LDQKRKAKEKQRLGQRVKKKQEGFIDSENVPAAANDPEHHFLGKPGIDIKGGHPAYGDQEPIGAFQEDHGLFQSVSGQVESSHRLWRNPDHLFSIIVPPFENYTTRERHLFSCAEIRIEDKEALSVRMSLKGF
jgi:hypothetical protein